MGKRIAVGVDIGGTKTLAVLASETGDILDSAEFATDRYSPPNVLLPRVADLVRYLVARAEANSIGVHGVGVGVPGLVAPNRRFIDSIILPTWFDVDVVGWLSAALERAVVVDNDATMAALGQWYVCVAEFSHLETLLCLTLGTGVGGAIIVDGQPRRGPDGTAGQLGHLTLDIRGRPCQCGSRGCLNAYVSGTAIAERYVELQGREDEGGADSDTLTSSNRVTGRWVADAAQQGNRLALRVLAETSDYLGAGLASLVDIFNPDVIVLTGGVSLLGEQLLAPAREVVSQRAFSKPAQRVRIEAGRFGVTAGAVGAAVTALNSQP